MDAVSRRFVLVGLTLLLALPLSARATATPALTVLPQRGPVGTLFTIEGSGLQGQTAAIMVVFTLVPNPAGGAIGARAQKDVFYGTVPVDAAGNLTVALDSTGLIPGDYIALLPQVSGRPQLTFTVVGIPAGLPNTGGGWAHERYLARLTP